MAQSDWVEKDYYKILGVSQTATKDEIKKAYRKLAQQHHPDANEGDVAAESRFKEISEAHAILSNEDKRKEYDHIRQFGGGFGFGNAGGRGRNIRVEDLGDLGDLFGGGGGSGVFEDLFGFGRRPARQGADAESTVHLSFDEAVTGTTVALSNGARVRIPAGVGDGSRIKAAGKGGPGSGGAPPRDLYVKVSVTPHPVFEMGKDGNLTVKVPVSYPEAVLGAKVTVPSLGAPVTVKVPPGTEHGKILRVKGKGAPRRGGGTGDLLVRIEVAVPKKLSRHEKEALEKFAEVHKESPREHLAGYITREDVS
ncbi:MAG: DnaJ C-terminal domain-containing protein [Actinomycetota bacterium]